MHISLGAEALFHIGHIVISNAILTTWIIMAILIGVAAALNKQLKPVPSRFQGFIETVYQYFWTMALEVTGRRDVAKDIMPCLLYTSPSPRDRQKSRMPSSA